MPICPGVHTTVLGGALGPSGPRPAKRGSPLLPDSATTERTDPVRRTETGRAGVFRTGNFRAAGGQPDDRTASSQVFVQPGTGVQPARQGHIRFTNEAREKFPATSFVQRRDEGSRFAAAIQGFGVQAHTS